MEISEKVVDEPGMRSYWLGSIDDNTVSFKDFSMTNDSTILDSVDVSEIGLRSLLISYTVVALESGETSASQVRPDLKEVLDLEVRS